MIRFLILSSNLQLCLQTGLFPLRFCVHFSCPPLRITRPACCLHRLRRSEVSEKNRPKSVGILTECLIKRISQTQAYYYESTWQRDG